MPTGANRRMIEIRGVHKEFSINGAVVTALSPTDLDVSRGEFISIIGPSGCGKSTLLRILAGLETPSGGSITLDDGSSARQRVGFVFQEPVLLPWLSTLENVRFPLDTAGIARTEADRHAADLLKLVGLNGFETALPRALSGGMRQRVSIARALSYDPALLLMDEPFGALDLITRDRLNDELLSIWAHTKKTILFVTHSVEEAAYLSDRVIVMSSRPGRIKSVYNVDLARPRGENTKLDPGFHQLMADLRRDLR
ncbi:ABC transporter ATP-binding protein [Microvirga pudoricolor]|uniref:ABC transporter ATP-binding protein n=1 Tax=Microvirga pudoricolor TaxID=2778729 RepID=UPI00194E28F4|nr:ABC transporter ATP-binding protein [Microvirga pudoricolor]MBM6593585.1 ABC transporter ATP-binding protein [Microvirga pudoricolor]